MLKSLMIICTLGTSPWREITQFRGEGRNPRTDKAALVKEWQSDTGPGGVN
jgi:hypothetical protein